MTYAATTSVSVDNLRAENEATLVRYGATMYSWGWDEEHAFVRFCVRERHIKMVLPLPKREGRRFTDHKDRYGIVRANTPAKSIDLYEQAKRSLFLGIKAKLESVESRIETFEQAFLAHIVLPDQTLVGDRVNALVDEAYRTGRMGRLALEAGESAADDAEYAEVVQ